MASKLTKILSGAALLAVMNFTSNANAAGLTPGMMIGVGGDMLFAINENTDFAYKVGATPPAGSALVKDEKYTFSSKKDSGYGGNVSFGYLMENGLAGELELGYRDIKYKDKTTKSTLETTNLTGLLKGTYYIDLGSVVYPYVMAGAGIARVDAKGTIYKDQAAAAPATASTRDDLAPPPPPAPAPASDATSSVKFDSLKHTVLAYQAGAGVATSVGSAILGAGYKFFGTYKMEDSKDHSDLKVQDGAGGKFTTNSDFKFGKLTQNVHTIEVFAKMVM